MNAIFRNLVIFSFTIFFAFSCASNKSIRDLESESKEASENLEDYYGVSKEDETLSNEDEVLKLLNTVPNRT